MRTSANFTSASNCRSTNCFGDCNFQNCSDRERPLERNKGMGDRAVYCARLESVCAERHPGFESPPIRQVAKSNDTRGVYACFNKCYFACLVIHVSRQPNR